MAEQNKNNANILYQRLTRLFRSGPAIQRKIKGQNYKNYYDNNLIHNNFGYRASNPFGKESSPFSILGGYGILDRMARYSEFSEMEYRAEIGSALNVYADETCAIDEKGKCFHVYTENAEIRKALEELFYDTLNVEFNLRSWARNLVKYGDFFLYNEVVPEHGVINVNPIPVDQIIREEGWDVEDPYSVRFKWVSRGNKILENWQISHFRILGNDLFLPYGTSVLDPARRIWRQLTLMEDAMMTYRVVRSPERRVFYIDVGNIAPNDIPSYMEAAKSALRSNSQIDKMNGRQDYRYNPVAMDEDYFVPVRGDSSGTKIESLPGGQHVSAIEDVEFLQKQLFAALQIPRAYLGYDNTSGKATLAQQDIKFSRTINIIQKIIVAELNKLAMIHLYAKGFDGIDLINFELFLSNPSSVAIQQKLALWSDRADIANKFKDFEGVSTDWILQEILGFTKEEIDQNKIKLKQEKLYAAELESIAVQEQPPRESIVDPFNSTNYNVPGSSVSKSQTGNNDINSLSDEEILSNISKFDSEGNIIKMELAPGKAPIKSTPYATRMRRNDKRLVGMGGRDNLAMPDFARALNYNQSQSLYDVTDNEFLNKPFKESVDKEDLIKNLGVKPEFSKEMKNIFEKLDQKFPSMKMKSKLLNEEKIDKKLEEVFEKYEASKEDDYDII